MGHRREVVVREGSTPRQSRHGFHGASWRVRAHAHSRSWAQTVTWGSDGRAPAWGYCSTSTDRKCDVSGGCREVRRVPCRAGGREILPEHPDRSGKYLKSGMPAPGTAERISPVIAAGEFLDQFHKIRNA